MSAEQTVKLSRLFVDRREMIASDDVLAVVSEERGAAEPPISTDPRVVARPAPRYHFPLDPLVAVQGANRSLRHGGDGRASTDGLLWCRWPHQTLRELKGLLTGDDVLPSLGNGSIPPEVLSIAQEAVLHSPYQRQMDRGPRVATVGDAHRSDRPPPRRRSGRAVREARGVRRPDDRLRRRRHDRGRPQRRRRPAPAPFALRRCRAVAGRRDRVVAAVDPAVARVGGRDRAGADAPRLVARHRRSRARRRRRAPARHDEAHRPNPADDRRRARRCRRPSAGSSRPRTRSSRPRAARARSRRTSRTRSPCSRARSRTSTCSPRRSTASASSCSVSTPAR